jgi:hypothetical protein
MDTKEGWELLPELSPMASFLRLDVMPLKSVNRQIRKDHQQLIAMLMCIYLIIIDYDYYYLQIII